MNIYITPTDTI